MSKLQSLKSTLFNTFSANALTPRQMLYLGGVGQCFIGQSDGSWNTWSKDNCTNNSEDKPSCSDGGADDPGGTLTHCDTLPKKN
jgi:hypothetical protein